MANQPGTLHQEADKSKHAFKKKGKDLITANLTFAATNLACVAGKE